MLSLVVENTHLTSLRLHVCSQFSNLVVSIIMLVSGYNNIIVLPNCTLLYYVFSGPLSLCAYVPEIKFNNNNCRRCSSFQPLSLTSPS